MTMQSVLQRFLIALSAVILATGLPACKQGEATRTHTGQGAEAQLERARQAIREGNYEAAFLALQSALATSPRDPQVHLDLGWLYLYMDEPAKTRAELEQLEGLDPDPAKVKHLQGALLAELDQHEDAVRLYEDAMKGQPRNAKLYFDLATSQMALNRNEAALSTLEEGFEYIPPDDLQSQVNFTLASCAVNSRLKNFEAAISDCEQAAEFEQNPEARQRITEMIHNMMLIRDIEEDMPGGTAEPSVPDDR